MAKQARDIEYLPAGWRWVGEGKATWTTAQGKQSTVRHAEGPNGATLSVRQVQNQQRAARAQQGQPKPAQIGRAGRIYTRADKGRTGTTWVFRNFQDAKAYIAKNGVPDEYKLALIQIRYSRRVVGSTNPNSDPKVSGGYATLGNYDTTEDFVEGALPASGPTLGPKKINRWYQAEQRLSEFDMSGKNARVYVYLSRSAE